MGEKGKRKTVGAVFAMLGTPPALQDPLHRGQSQPPQRPVRPVLRICQSLYLPCPPWGQFLSSLVELTSESDGIHKALNPFLASSNENRRRVVGWRHLLIHPLHQQHTVRHRRQPQANTRNHTHLLGGLLWS